MSDKGLSHTQSGDPGSVAGERQPKSQSVDTRMNHDASHLRIRKPGWYEHGMLEGGENEANLHVFSAGWPEVDRMLTFRDWLRANESDRELYARSKRTLAQQQWKYTQNYADAKTAVIGQILSRARRTTR